jgi:hypothetical protein
MHVGFGIICKPVNPSWLLVMISDANMVIRIVHFLLLKAHELEVFVSKAQILSHYSSRPQGKDTLPFFCHSMPLFIKQNYI